MAHEPAARRRTVAAAWPEAFNNSTGLPSGAGATIAAVAAVAAAGPGAAATDHELITANSATIDPTAAETPAISQESAAERVARESAARNRLAP